MVRPQSILTDKAITIRRRHQIPYGLPYWVDDRGSRNTLDVWIHCDVHIDDALEIMRRVSDAWARDLWYRHGRPNPPRYVILRTPLVPRQAGGVWDDLGEVIHIRIDAHLDADTALAKVAELATRELGHAWARRTRNHTPLAATP
jgi:hypothetical protein